MRRRVFLGSSLIRLGRFIQSLAIMMMKPDDLVEFSRLDYATPGQLRYWAGEDLVNQGLNPLESALLDMVPVKTGRLLLLCLGGGRDAVALARRGFAVTGVDFVPEIVQQAQENALRHGVQLAGLVQEISQLALPAGSFDIAWLANSMYSCLPTRKRRVAMLQRIRWALKPGGYFFCSFHWEKMNISPRVEYARRIFAFLTLGNLTYEPGDLLVGNQEFIHAFSSEDDLKSEFAQGGFGVLDLKLPESGVEGGALLVSKSEAR
jgi:SAM-dependent methyltransferase